nr:MAG TPA: hypothetical protein [Caudoviricetes sp.]
MFARNPSSYLHRRKMLHANATGDFPQFLIGGDDLVYYSTHAQPLY